MKAIILKSRSMGPVFSEIAIAVCKANYEAHRYDTSGTIELEGHTTVEEFIEACFDYTNNPVTEDAWGRQSINTGDILVIMNDQGGAYLCKSVGWECIDPPLPSAT